MREKMLKSAIHSMMDDYDESVQRMSAMAKLDDTPFIHKEKVLFLISLVICAEVKNVRKSDMAMKSLLLFM